jgi:hypothetical protein
VYGAVGHKPTVLNIFTTGLVYDLVVESTTVFIARSYAEPVVKTFSTTDLSPHGAPPAFELAVKLITTSSHKIGGESPDSNNIICSSAVQVSWAKNSAKIIHKIED